MGVEKAPDGGGGRRGAFAAEKPSRAGRPVRRRRPTGLPRWRGWAGGGGHREEAGGGPPRGGGPVDAASSSAGGTARYGGRWT